MLNAQFDVDVARRGIQHEPWNSWLFARLADLAAAAALARLSTNAAGGWKAVPLEEEAPEVNEPWIDEHITGLVTTVQKRVRSGCRISVAGRQLPLRSMAYEAESLARIVQ